MEPWLYVVLLGAVLVVYARLIPGSRADSKQTNVIKEIEDTMEQFSAELEEENRQLLQLVSEMKKDHDLHSAKLQGRIEALERQNRDVLRQLSELLHGGEAGRGKLEQSSAYSSPLPEHAAAQTVSPAAAPAASPEPDKPTGVLRIKDRYPELFTLDRQGKSIEQIAKKLAMNKGEVMLILQLAKQEEQPHDPK